MKEIDTNILHPCDKEDMIERARKRHYKVTPTYDEADIIAGNYPSEHFTMRLQRYLARAGVASRRGSEKLISAGRVSVNGRTITELGTKVSPRDDTVCVDGVICKLGDEHVYLMLHKPQGYLTTMSDPFGHPCVKELVPKDTYPGLFPVGRLDADTTGLLLFSTDGTMGNRLLHPSHHVEKTYLCVVAGHLSKAAQHQLERGIMLEDGITQPARIRMISNNHPHTRLDATHSIMDTISKKIPYTICELTIHEGRYHQVKRMFDAVDAPVLRLHRLSFGPLRLQGDILYGKWRMCTESEVAQLIQIVSDTSTTHPA